METLPPAPQANLSIFVHHLGFRFASPQALCLRLLRRLIRITIVNSGYQRRSGFRRGVGDGLGRFVVPSSISGEALRLRSYSIGSPASFNFGPA